ncbi:MAG: tetratricopeptide repeat protein [Phycisphaerales bacterium]
MIMKRFHPSSRVLGIIRAIALCACLLGSLAPVHFANGADAPSTKLDSADLRKLFESGNESFRKGLEISKADRPASEAKFREAAGAWREVARSGEIHNVKLETNIANASLLAGDVPGAILAYRRALAIDPSNAEVRAGLAAARRSAGTEALAQGKDLSRKEDAARVGGFRGAISVIVVSLQAAAEVATNIASSRALLVVAIMCYVAFFAGLTLRVLGKLRVPGIVLGLVFISLLLSFGPLALREARAAHPTDAVVVGSHTVARSGPADLYDPAFQEPLRAGLEVEIEESRGAWAKIRLRDGRSAWVRADSIERI